MEKKDNNCDKLLEYNQFYSIFMLISTDLVNISRSKDTRVNSRTMPHSDNEHNVILALYTIFIRHKRQHSTTQLHNIRKRQRQK